MSEKPLQPYISDPLIFRKFFASKENLDGVKLFLKDVVYFQCEELILEKGEAYSVQKMQKLHKAHKLPKNTVNYRAKIKTGEELRVVISNLKNCVQTEIFRLDEAKPLRVKRFEF